LVFYLNLIVSTAPEKHKSKHPAQHNVGPHESSPG
jgi:hypothetical protein